jgi:hypothetical protein
MSMEYWRGELTKHKAKLDEYTKTRREKKAKGEDTWYEDGEIQFHSNAVRQASEAMQEYR